MKITVEISEKELKEIQHLTKEKRKGPAIRQLALDALRLRKRRLLGKEVLEGKLSAEIPSLEKLRKDRSL